MLKQYSFTIEHCRGKDNVVADFLSRNLEGRFASHDSDRLYGSQIVRKLDRSNIRNRKEYMLTHYDDLMKTIETLQSNDSLIQQWLSHLGENGQGKYSVLNKIFFHQKHGGIKWRIVIPQVLILPVVAHVHCKLGHAGIFDTLEYLKQSYFWNGMSSHTKQYIKCDLCLRIKSLNFAMEGADEHVGAFEPSELVNVDFYGPLPGEHADIKYLFVLMDSFSKYVCLYPVKRATTNICLKRVEFVYSLHWMSRNGIHGRFHGARGRLCMRSRAIAMRGRGLLLI